MKTAFAYWDNRIAPVFDVARRLHLVEDEAGRIIAEREEVLADELPVQRAVRLAELGLGTLVCGAISRPLQALVAAYGIRVVPFVAGDLREVIQAWLKDGLYGNAFAMPGCCRPWRQRFKGMHDRHQEVSNMNGRGRGMGGGGRQDGGRGQGGQRPGRVGGISAAGPVGNCVCPQCGQKEPHQRGVPCVERKCPTCGIMMIRE